MMIDVEFHGQALSSQINLCFDKLRIRKCIKIRMNEIILTPVFFAKIGKFLLIARAAEGNQVSSINSKYAKLGFGQMMIKFRDGLNSTDRTFIDVCKKSRSY